jgi:hypothetical protein
MANRVLKCCKADVGHGQERVEPGLRTRLRVKQHPMPANVRQLIARHCKRNSLAGIGQRWLGMERATGIENTAGTR